MTWNSSPLRLNHRTEISSPSALAQWTEHRKACTETAFALLPVDLTEEAIKILTVCALVGAIGVARAVSDQQLSREILKTVAQLLKNPLREATSATSER